MKKIIFFILLSSIVFSQQPDIEIRLVNANIGASITYNANQLNEYSSSNDTRINAILNLYGAHSYINKNVHPYQPYNGRIISIPGVYPQQFITDLQAYSNVIEYVHVSNRNYFSDALFLQLVDLNIGSPIGFNGNIVVTNNTSLNQIFQNYNVYYYAQTFPSSTWNVNLRNFTVLCNCDINLLSSQLNNLSLVIERTDNAGVTYLSNSQFEKSKTTIYPNPFYNTFYIETIEAISNYTVFDSTGKKIGIASNKNELDNLTSKLQTGFYVLNLVFENGLTSNFKLVKK